MRRARTSRTRAPSASFAGDAWRLGPDTAPIVVAGAGAEPVIEQLGLFLYGWRVRPAEPADFADIQIGRTASGGYAVSGSYGAVLEFDNALDAANGAAGALVMVVVARDASLICLHAGAARIGAGIVALVGNSGAGKSSVALMLAELGHLLFGDDRIGIRPGDAPEAMSFGLAPKARQPLPPGSGAAYARFIMERTAYAGEIATYLRMKPGEAAPFGATAPLAAVVILARGASGDGPAPLSPSQAVRALVPHCYAADRPADALVRALEGLARRVPVLRLPFASSPAAAALLAAEFAPAEDTANG